MPQDLSTFFGILRLFAQYLVLKRHHYLCATSPTHARSPRTNPGSSVLFHKPFRHFAESFGACGASLS